MKQKLNYKLILNLDSWTNQALIDLSQNLNLPKGMLGRLLLTSRLKEINNLGLENIQIEIRRLKIENGRE